MTMNMTARGADGRGFESSLPLVRTIGMGLMCILGFGALGVLGQQMARGTPPMPPWNPAVAVVIVVLSLCGLRWLPVLLIAAAASALGTTLAAGRSMADVPPLLLWHVIETLVYAGAAQLLRHRLRINPDLPGFEDVFRFIAVVSVSAMLMAALFAVSLWIFGNAPSRPLIPFLRYWLGDMDGLAVVGPFILVYRNLPFRSATLRTLLSWECAAQAAAIIGELFLIFPRTVGSRFSPMFIPLVWIAARHGLAGIATVLLPIQLSFVTAAALLGLQANQVVKLQILMLTLSLTGLLLGAVISDRERARASVIAGEKRLKAIIDMAPDGLLITDDVGHIEMVNRQFENLCALPAAVLLGQPIDRFLLAGTDSGNGQTAIHRADGRSVPVETSSAAVAIGDERCQVVAVRDVTARKQAEADLGRRRSAIEHASRSSLTGELAAALAHELNQPLTAIVNYTAASQRLLANGKDVALARAQMSKASQQAERAGQVIRRLREFFCNAGITTQAVSLAAMMREVLLLMADETARAETAVEVDLDDHLVAQIDPLQIQQVMINLLRNSLDALAGADGGHRVVRVSGALEPSGFIRVTLADTGPGIAPEVSERLFKPFTTTRSFGMGLGLSISRSIIQAHGGDLWVAAATGTGAAVHFTLPAAACPPDTTPIDTPALAKSPLVMSNLATTANAPA